MRMGGSPVVQQLQKSILSPARVAFSLFAHSSMVSFGSTAQLSISVRSEKGWKAIPDTLTTQVRWSDSLPSTPPLIHFRLLVHQPTPSFGGMVRCATSAH